MLQFMDSSVATIIEESVVDPSTQTFRTITRNITLTKYMLIEEDCVYTAAPENPHW